MWFRGTIYVNDLINRKILIFHVYDVSQSHTFISVACFSPSFNHLQCFKMILNNCKLQHNVKDIFYIPCISLQDVMDLLFKAFAKFYVYKESHLANCTCSFEIF